jgi:putative protein kinase ArgK-like GTPase of G3E family
MDCRFRLGEVGETMLPETLLFQTAEESFDDPAFFGIGVDIYDFSRGMTVNVRNTAGYLNVHVRPEDRGGTGDEIQALKVGVMEMEDIFVVNKRDLEGADKLRDGVEYVLSFKSPNGGERANPIVMASALRDEGIEELASAVAVYRERLAATGGLERKRRFRTERELEGALTRRLHELLDVHIDFSREIHGWVDHLLRREARPYTPIDDQIRNFLKEAIQ